MKTLITLSFSLFMFFAMTHCVSRTVYYGDVHIEPLLNESKTTSTTTTTRTSSSSTTQDSQQQTTANTADIKRVVQDELQQWSKQNEGKNQSNCVDCEKKVQENLQSKFKDIDDRLSQLNQKIARVDEKEKQVNEKLSSIEKQQEELRKQKEQNQNEQNNKHSHEEFGQLAQQIKDIQESLNALKNRSNNNGSGDNNSGEKNEGSDNHSSDNNQALAKLAQDIENLQKTLEEHIENPQCEIKKEVLEDKKFQQLMKEIIKDEVKSLGDDRQDNQKTSNQKNQQPDRQLEKFKEEMKKIIDEKLQEAKNFCKDGCQSSSKNNQNNSSNDNNSQNAQATVYFANASAKLSEMAVAELNALPIKANSEVVITGYTDNTGNYDYNVKLSKERATAVKNYLLKKSPKAKYEMKFFGPNMPAKTNKTKEGRAHNRRVEIFLKNIEK